MFWSYLLSLVAASTATALFTPERRQVVIPSFFYGGYSRFEPCRATVCNGSPAHFPSHVLIISPRYSHSNSRSRPYGSIGSRCSCASTSGAHVRLNLLLYLYQMLGADIGYQILAQERRHSTFLQHKSVYPFYCHAHTDLTAAENLSRLYERLSYCVANIESHESFRFCTMVDSSWIASL